MLYQWWQQLLELVPSDPRERAILTLALASGLLQALGYGFYLWKTFQKNIVPHPLTWAMFGYGTGLLFAIELDRGASWQLLILPGVCALCSLVVVAICFVRGGYKRELDFDDGFVFVFDLMLTIFWFTLDKLYEGQVGRDAINLLILAAWNVGVFTSFRPMFRDVLANPGHEHPLPWMIWTAAYASLLAATYLESPDLALLLFPGTNMVAHALIAILSRKKRRERKAREPVRKLIERHS